VPELIEALRNKNEDIRWEAAKALGQIKDTMAAPALVKALSDKNFGVRWLAAEGLIIMRNAAIPPLLQELIQHPDVIWLRQGAYHVLHDLAKKRGFSQQVAPVLAALEGLEPALKVPMAAKNLLDTITIMKKPRVKRRLEY
jgi:HEAT repeat protein